MKNLILLSKLMYLLFLFIIPIYLEWFSLKLDQPLASSLLIQQYLHIMQLSLDFQAQNLDIIIVSDIHLNHDMVQRLAKSVKGTHFDYCIVGGDVANCDHEKNTHNEQQQVEETNNCLNRLQQILQCKVLWIPGNHDPLYSLKGEQHPNQNIINIHKQDFVLEVGLTISGLGGSLPAYTDLQSKSQVWPGYPYQSEQQYAFDVEQVFREGEVPSSKIFLTHVGPSVSNTTVHRRTQSPVYAGSRSLNKLLDRNDFLLLIHGHVHNGGKYDMFKGKPIVNPGALLDGQYAFLKLTRAHKVWNIGRISFGNLTL